MHHPYLRGTLLALTLVAAFTLGAPVNLGAVQLVMAAVGAGLAALPGRIARRQQPRPRLSWQRCLRGFLGGLGVTLGCLVAGGGWLWQWLLALGTGGLGSVIFTMTALALAVALAQAGGGRPA